MAALPDVQFTLLVGQYAIAYHLKNQTAKSATLTQTVQNHQQWWPKLLPTPHSSPRNNLWLRRNPWFEQEVVPKLQTRVAEILG